MKTIDKAQVDKLIEVEKEYGRLIIATHNVDEVEENLLQLLDEEQTIAEKIFGFEVGMSVGDILRSIFKGAKPAATNEDIYKVLAVLGWNVE